VDPDLEVLAIFDLLFRIQVRDGKLLSFQYSQERYLELKKKIGPYLKNAGYFFANLWAGNLFDFPLPKAVSKTKFENILGG
jgi:hypothetical protein